MSQASRLFTHRSLRRRHLAGFVVLGTLALWGGVWGFAAYRANALFDSLIAKASLNGIQVTFSKRFTNGTPFDVHVHFDPLAIRLKNGNEIKAKESVFYLNIWDWNAFSGKFRDGIEASFLGEKFKADIIKFGAHWPRKPAEDHTQTGLSLWLQPFTVAFDASPPFALGNVFDEGLFRFRIMGPPPDFTAPRSIEAWSKDGGIVEFDRFYVNWGPMEVTANGTVALDQKLQPQGAFSGRLSGLDEIVSMLVVQEKLKEHQVSLLRSAIGVLSRPSSMTGSSPPVVPFSIQDGGVYLGPVKLMDMPPIVWE